MNKDKVIARVHLFEGMDYDVQLIGYDNGDGPKKPYYQLHVTHTSDTGVSQTAVFPIEVNVTNESMVRKLGLPF